MPARGERPRLRFAVANDCSDDEVGVVERRAVGMGKRVAELAAFVNGAGRFRRHVTRNPAWKRELGEEPLHAFDILRDTRIDLAVRAFEIGVGDDPRPAMPGADDIDHVEVVFLNQPVEMRVDEVEAWRRAPVPEQTRLDVLLFERFAQQGIVEQVDLTDGQIIGRAPVGVDERAFGFRQGACGFRRAFLFRQSGRGRHRHLLSVSFSRLTVGRYHSHDKGPWRA